MSVDRTIGPLVCFGKKVKKGKKVMHNDQALERKVCARFTVSWTRMSLVCVCISIKNNFEMYVL